jgi:hypothetical protein
MNFPGPGQRRWSEGRTAEHNIGQQTLEIDFLKGCLQRMEEQRMLQDRVEIRSLRPGREEMKAARGLIIRRLVGLGRFLGPASTLRYRTEDGYGSRHGVAGRDPAHRVGVAVLGTVARRPRVTPPEMEDQSKTRVSADARRQPAVCATTDSNHSRRVYPNLACALVLTGVNQL